MYDNYFAWIINNERIDYERIQNEWLYENNHYSIRENYNQCTVFDLIKKAVEGTININVELDYTKNHSNIKNQIIDECILKLDKRILELEVKEEYNKKEKDDKKYDLTYYKWRSLAPKTDFSAIYSIRYFKAIIQEILKGNLSYSFFEDLFSSEISNSEVLIQKAIVEILSTDSISRANVRLNAIKMLLKVSLDKHYEIEKEYTGDSIYILLWYAQIFTFVTLIENKQMNELLNKDSSSIVINEGVYYLSNLFSNKCWNKNKLNQGIEFAKISTNALNPEVKQDSYNLIGLCAIESGNYQLAYDAYFTWINRKSTKEVSYIVSSNEMFESEWRLTDLGKKREANMRSNYAYVCASIYQTMEKDDIRWKAFYNIAIKEIDISQKLDPIFPGYYCTKGTILSDNEEYENSLLEYQKYAKLTVNNNGNKENYISALRQCMITNIDIMTQIIINNKYKYSFDRETNAAFVRVLDSIEKYADSITKHDIKDGEEFEQWLSFSKLFSLHKYFLAIKADSKLEYLLLLIYSFSKRMVSNLSRHDYSNSKYYTRNSVIDDSFEEETRKANPIAYYTSFSTAKHLFNKTVKTDSEGKNQEEKNCFTIMHAKYMNDPNEGLRLLESLFFENQIDSKKFRQEIYNNHFIFFKSFTESIDSLIMWNRYGRSSGGDSDGCCLKIDPRTFESILVDEGKQQNKQIEQSDDDYNLYRIVYISKNGVIEDNNNKGIRKCVKDDYDFLICLIKDLSEVIKNIDDNTKNEIFSFLQHCFRFLIFLFKDDDYSHEKESRIIIMRSRKNTKTIKIVSDDPPLLCIQPFFQVYVNEVIIGPNCNNSEKWEPYIQLRLEEMWREIEDKRKLSNQSLYSIKHSKIKYTP